MKVITEALLREQLRAETPETFYIPEGKILSPAAREYLQQRKIKISKDPPPAPAAPEEPKAVAAEAPVRPVAKYVDEETGAFYTEKPEHMTHLYGNVLVPKAHPHIFFRGKLDSLGAQIVLTQSILAETAGNEKLIADLQDILTVLHEMMRCDALNEPFRNETLIGLTHAQLRERSHDPMRFFHIPQMTMPDYKLGRTYAMLNQLRTQVRETEVAANQAFRDGKKCTNPPIVEELNRMSSAMHIMMCMYLAGMYTNG